MKEVRMKLVKLLKIVGKVRPKAFRREMRELYVTCDECGTRRKAKRMWKETDGSIVDCLIICPTCAKKQGGK